jgi:hypothetical protein
MQRVGVTILKAFIPHSEFRAPHFNYTFALTPFADSG